MTKILLTAIWIWVIGAAFAPVTRRDLKNRCLFKLRQNLAFLHTWYSDVHLVRYRWNLLSSCAMRTMLSLAWIWRFAEAFLCLENRVLKSRWYLNLWVISSCDLDHVLGLAIHKLPFETVFDHRNTRRYWTTAVRVMDLWDQPHLVDVKQVITITLCSCLFARRVWHRHLRPQWLEEMFNVDSHSFYRHLTPVTNCSINGAVFSWQVTSDARTLFEAWSLWNLTFWCEHTCANQHPSWVKPLLAL